MQKSLLNQIIDEMFVRAEKQLVFDAETIQNLKRLAESGDIENVQHVAEAIRSVPKKHDESA